jgi:hypothetical protein
MSFLKNDEKNRQAALLVNSVYFVNLVRNLPFSKSKLMREKGSHKVHKVHKVHKFIGDGQPYMQFL